MSNRLNVSERLKVSNRVIVLGVSFVAGVLWVALLTVLLSGNPESTAADLLLDRNTRLFPYPFTIQNLMWIVFSMAAGELVVRLMAGRREEEQLARGLLPEDHRTVFRRRDIGPVYRRVSESDPDGRFWLQRLLSGSLLQYQSTGSIEQVSTMLNMSLELCQNEIELRYNMLRYYVWLIPTLGFVGTVMGIAFALRTAGTVFAAADPASDMVSIGPTMMEGMTGDLGVAFYTTLLALLQSAVLMFALHLMHEREERALNRVGQYCLKNLVNRLYEPGTENEK